MIFSEFKPTRPSTPRRYHAFLRALEGAFLIHRDGEDQVVLNRKSEGEHVQVLEIALCRECGQHYYVGRERGGKLVEAIRDPSHPGFGVDYYLPAVDGVSWLCRRCGSLSNAMPQCDCGAALQVKRCESTKITRISSSSARLAGIIAEESATPVQEIVHGSDGLTQSSPPHCTSYFPATGVRFWHSPTAVKRPRSLLGMPKTRTKSSVIAI